MSATRYWTTAALMALALASACGGDDGPSEVDAGEQPDLAPEESEERPPACVITTEQAFVSHPGYVDGGTGELGNPHVLRGIRCRSVALRDLDFHFALVDVTVDASDADESAGIEVTHTAQRSGLIAESLISGSRGVGIWATDAPGLRIVDTVVTDSVEEGIRLASSPGASVAGCALSDNGTGVSLDASSNAVVYHTSVERSAVGIEISGDSRDVMVTDCEVRDAAIGIHVADESVAFTAITNNRLRDNEIGVVSGGESIVIMGNHVGPSGETNLRLDASASRTVAAVNLFERPGSSHVSDSGDATRWWIDGSEAWFEQFVSVVNGQLPPSYTDIAWGNTYREPSLCDAADAPEVVATDVWGHVHRYRDDGPSCLYEALSDPRWFGVRSFMDSGVPLESR